MHKIRSLIAAAVLAIATGAVIHNELQPPAIATVPVTGDDPLTLRFSVSNPALVVAARNVDFVCLPLSVRGRGADGQTIVTRADPFPMKMDIDLGPGASFQYTCPIKGETLPAKVDRMTARVAVSYTRFGHRTETMSGLLSWDSQSRVWTQSSPAD